MKTQFILTLDDYWLNLTNVNIIDIKPVGFKGPPYHVLASCDLTENPLDWRGPFHKLFMGTWQECLDFITSMIDGESKNGESNE